MHHGSWPKYTIDHIDRNKLNNRIENLRDVTQSVNNSNTGKGYHWCKRERKFLVYYREDGKRRYYGRFSCEEEASNIANELNKIV